MIRRPYKKQKVRLVAKFFDLYAPIFGSSTPIFIQNQLSGLFLVKRVLERKNIAMIIYFQRSFYIIWLLVLLILSINIRQHQFLYSFRKNIIKFMRQIHDRNSHLSQDAFIRLAVLESKIARNDRMEKIMHQISSIQRWNISQDKMELFVHRVKGFKDKLGLSCQVVATLVKIIEKMKEIDISCSLNLTVLLCQNHPFMTPQVLEQLIGDMLNRIDPENVVFDRNLLCCCFEFCKLTRIQSDFQVIVHKCCRKINQLLEILNNQFQEQNIRDCPANSNSTLKAQSAELFQLLFKFYCIGMLKFLKESQRKDCKAKAFKLLMLLPQRHTNKSNEELVRQTCLKITNSKGKVSWGSKLRQLRVCVRERSERLKLWKINFAKIKIRKINFQEHIKLIQQKPIIKIDLVENNAEGSNEKQSNLLTERKPLIEVQNQIYDIKVYSNTQVENDTRTPTTPQKNSLFLQSFQDEESTPYNNDEQQERCIEESKSNQLKFKINEQIPNQQSENPMMSQILQGQVSRIGELIMQNISKVKEGDRQILISQNCENYPLEQDVKQICTSHFESLIIFIVTSFQSQGLNVQQDHENRSAKTISISLQCHSQQQIPRENVSDANVEANHRNVHKIEEIIQQSVKQQFGLVISRFVEQLPAVMRTQPKIPKLSTIVQLQEQIEQQSKQSDLEQEQQQTQPTQIQKQQVTIEEHVPSNFEKSKTLKLQKRQLSQLSNQTIIPYETHLMNLQVGQNLKISYFVTLNERGENVVVGKTQQKQTIVKIPLYSFHNIKLVKSAIQLKQNYFWLNSLHNHFNSGQLVVLGIWMERNVAQIKLISAEGGENQYLSILLYEKFNSNDFFDIYLLIQHQPEAKEKFKQKNRQNEGIHRKKVRKLKKMRNKDNYIKIINIDSKYYKRLLRNIEVIVGAYISINSQGQIMISTSEPSLESILQYLI